MANPNINKVGKRFTKDYQPTGAAKSAGVIKIADFKAAVKYFGLKGRSKVNFDGQEVEFSYQANIVFRVFEKANNGDLKAAEMVSRWLGWDKPIKYAETDPEGEAPRLMSDAQFHTILAKLNGTTPQQ